MGCIRYYITWEESNGAKGSLVSPHLRSKGAALWWLLQLKPHIDLTTVQIRAWDLNCKEK